MSVVGVSGVRVSAWCGGSSSSSSQDRLIGPRPAKCWPEAFHATLIHSIRERGKTERMEEKLRYRYQYHHHQ